MVFINCVGQCPVSQPTITSQAICKIKPSPLQGPVWGVAYVCNDPDNVIIWNGSAFIADLVVSRYSGNVPPTLVVSGVTVKEFHTSDSSCIKSTLTFSGNNLNALNGLSLSCRINGKIAVTEIMIPRECVHTSNCYIVLI